MCCVRAKIGLTGQFDRWKPGNHFKPCSIHKCLRKFSLIIKSRNSSLVKIFTRSRRDLGENRGEIAACFWPPRFPHLAEITAEIAARSRRDTGNLGGQKLAAISAAKNAPRSRRDSRRDAGNLGGQKRAGILAEIAARYGNLGGQIRGEMLQRDRGEIRKSRQPKRAVIAR